MAAVAGTPVAAVTGFLAAGVLFTTEPEALSNADALFICVPSPLGRNRQPDLTFIEAAATTVVAEVGEVDLTLAHRLEPLALVLVDLHRPWNRSVEEKRGGDCGQTNRYADRRTLIAVNFDSAAAAALRGPARLQWRVACSSEPIAV